MPSWPDGDETSSGERLTDYSSDVPLNVPEHLYDPDFCGIETDCPETCDHNEKLARYVAFEGENTGKKFLGCAKSGSAICGTVHWLDLEWPPSLNRCLVRLWELYDTECSQRIKESCESSSAYYKLNLEKKQILEKNKELQIELGKALGASQGSSSSSSENAMSIANLLELHKCVTENAEKKRDGVIEENKKLIVMKEKAERENHFLQEQKKKLEYALGDLFNAADLNKQKLKKIKQILDE